MTSFLFILFLKLFDLGRKLVTIQIREPAPILLRSVMVEILSIIPIVYLLRVVRVLPLLKVCGNMCYLVFLLIPADSPLFLFQTSFFIGCKLEVTVL